MLADCLVVGIRVSYLCLCVVVVCLLVPPERVDTVRAGAAKGPAFAAALVVDGCYLCAHVACELGLVGLG